MTDAAEFTVNGLSDAWADWVDEQDWEECLIDPKIPQAHFAVQAEDELAKTACRPMATEEPPKTQSPEHHTALAIEAAIGEIDKNSSNVELMNEITKVVHMMVALPPPQVEVYLEMIGKEFQLNARKIAALRKEFTRYAKEAGKEREQAEIERFVRANESVPEEPSEHEKQEALDYLMNPNLIENVSRDIAFAGGIIGEETNRMVLYLAGLSRKFARPVSAVVFGKSSTGKSYLANAILKLIPPEDRLDLSSSSAKALNYAGEQIKHKFLLIQEWDGAEEILPTIRVLQSEGKISRLVTVRDPDTQKPIAQKYEVECPCTVIITTTQEGIHDENSTRIFELYADDSIKQTKKVVKANLLAGSLNHRLEGEDKEQIVRLHHNIQRLLEPLEVDIPFAQYLSFPARSARNRRDSERFIQLIKAVTFLRQKQKNVKNRNGIRYVEADLEDYETAYRLGIDVIKGTLDQLSASARAVLRVCCELSQQLSNNGNSPRFVTIQRKNCKVGKKMLDRVFLTKVKTQCYVSDMYISAPGTSARTA